MASIIDERARAAIARRRGRGCESALVLWVAAVSYPGSASEPEVLSIDWASRQRLQRAQGLARWEDGDIVLYVDARLRRYTQAHDLRVSAWRLGPFVHLVIPHAWDVLRELQAWERAHPARRSRVAVHAAQGEEGARLPRPLSLGGRSGTREEEERIVATKSVLVVEDDPTLARAIARNLSARGYVTRSATTVADATAAIAEANPALVLLDIDLPDGSGWEVLRGLRTAGHSDVPVIVMSALRPNPRLCKDLRPTGVLEKPFPMEALLRQVATLLGRSAAPAVTPGGGEG
jgi:CheY-like chemotaxis protein